MKPLLRKALLIGAGLALAAPMANAAYTVNNGDLILGFQATSGTGATQNVFFNLGSPIAYRDGTNPTYLGNINDTLTAVYGAGWYNRSDLQFGVIANLNPNLPGGLGAPAPVNGDPSATLYVSQPTLNIGQSLPLTGYSATALNNIGGRVQGLESIFSALDTTSDNAAILDQSLHALQWNNSWSHHNPGAPESAFGIISGTIEQTFGQGTPATYVDLQRILSTANGADPSGTVGTGEYIVTFAVGSDGSIYAIPEPSTTLLFSAAALGSVLIRRRTRGA